MPLKLLSFSTIFGICISLLNLSCMKVLNKISEDDPCIKAYLERKKLKHTSDHFEREQIQLQAETYDKLCQDRNKNLPKSNWNQHCAVLSLKIVENKRTFWITRQSYWWLLEMIPCTSYANCLFQLLRIYKNIQSQ